MKLAIKERSLQIHQAIPVLPYVEVEDVLVCALNRHEDHRACDAVEKYDDE